MYCTTCGHKLAEAAKFCSECGARVPEAPASLTTNQEIGTVKGDVVGTRLDNLPSSGLRTNTDQQVDSVEAGGTVVGTVLGSPTGQTHIGGTQHYTGDSVSGDKISVGDITASSGVAIGRGAHSTVRNVHTGGGDYAEGTIDKRQGTFVRGDQLNLSGNVSGAILNIKSALTNVSQRIGAAPHGDDRTRSQLRTLLDQLSGELQQVPAAYTSDAEAVAETAKAALEQATKAQPNQALVQISTNGLTQAAQSLSAVRPAVLPLAERIAEAIRELSGG